MSAHHDTITSSRIVATIGFFARLVSLRHKRMLTHSTLLIKVFMSDRITLSRICSARFLLRHPEPSQTFGKNVFVMESLWAPTTGQCRPCTALSDRF